MAAPAPSAPAPPHHGRTHHHPNYLMIFWILAILTVLEVGVIFMPMPKMTINVLLGAMALAKAALVAAYFMHLRFEARTLGVIAVTPLAIAILLIFVILPDSFAIIKQTEKRKAVPTATAPAKP
jgi:cytochrome c oxidase subunit IV